MNAQLLVCNDIQTLIKLYMLLQDLDYVLFIFFLLMVISFLYFKEKQARATLWRKNLHEIK